MRLLILDHIRRQRWWLLAFAALQFGIGFIDYRAAIKGALDIIPFELQIMLLVGVFPLTLDLSRGLVRCVSSLPLTVAQIGRAWWLATVGLPSVTASALLFLGAETCHLVRPGSYFPVDTLALTSLYGFLWLGLAFTVIFHVGVMGSGPWWWRVLSTLVLSITWGIMLGGGILFFPPVLRHPIATWALFGFAAIMTLVGWLRAGHYVMGRVSYRRTLQPGNLRGQYRVTTGYGGLRRLFSTSFIRGFTMCLVITGIMQAMESGWKPWHQAIESPSLNALSTPVTIAIILLVTPLVQHLRFLRTLPMSPTKLASTMVLIVSGTLVAVGAATAITAGLTVGESAGMRFLERYILVSGPAAFGVPLALWLGVGQRKIFVLMVTMGVAAAVINALVTHVSGISVSLALLLAGIPALVAIQLARLLLVHGSRPYNIRTNTIGTPA